MSPTYLPHYSHLLTDRRISMNIKTLTAYPDWINKFGQSEVEWLAEEIRAWMENNDPDEREYECADNFRLSQANRDTTFVAVDYEYDKIRRNGCCGSEDIQFGPSPDGHTYVFGFNYGH